MSGTTHLRWRGHRTRCGIGTSMTYNHERVTCRTCLKLGPQQLEMFPRDAPHQGELLQLQEEAGG